MKAQIVYSLVYGVLLALKVQVGGKTRFCDVDKTILNDNTYPRHIWAYLCAGRGWSDPEPPANWELNTDKLLTYRASHLRQKYQAYKTGQTANMGLAQTGQTE